MLSERVRETILKAQKNEITEYVIYNKLARVIKDKHNKEILKEIAQDELSHYKFWKRYTKKDLKPSQLKIYGYFLLARVLGLTFGIKLMERGEEEAQVTYKKISKEIPEADKIVKDESDHEKAVLELIDEEKLKYVGSVVLGLNDALVELTGALAGFTLALQDTRLVALTGLITGIAASLSMATSEYLSKKSERKQNPSKFALYTGSAYVITVFILIIPFLILSNVFLSLGISLLLGLLIIFSFTFYISVAQELSFKKRFLEMALISLGIASLSFGIGFLVKHFLGVEI